MATIDAKKDLPNGEMTIEKLKSLPMVERVAYCASAMQQFGIAHAAASQGVPLTKQQLILKERNAAKAEAYSKAFIMLTQVFEEELSELMASEQPKIEVVPS